MRFPAIARAIALLCVLQDILVLESENRFKCRGLLSCIITQETVHWRCIHDLSGIENMLRIPGLFELTNEFVILVTDHLPDEFASQSAITVFSAE